jgi:hypothetical protein
MIMLELTVLGCVWGQYIWPVLSSAAGAIIAGVALFWFAERGGWINTAPIITAIINPYNGEGSWPHRIDVTVKNRSDKEIQVKAIGAVLYHNEKKIRPFGNGGFFSSVGAFDTGNYQQCHQLPVKLREAYLRQYPDEEIGKSALSYEDFKGCTLTVSVRTAGHRGKCVQTFDLTL